MKCIYLSEQPSESLSPLDIVDPNLGPPLGIQHKGWERRGATLSLNVPGPTYLIPRIYLTTILCDNLTIK